MSDGMTLNQAFAKTKAMMETIDSERAVCLAAMAKISNSQNELIRLQHDMILALAKKDEAAAATSSTTPPKESLSSSSKTSRPTQVAEEGKE